MRRDYSARRHVRGTAVPERRDYTCGWCELELGTFDTPVVGAIHITRAGADLALCGTPFGPEVHPNRCGNWASEPARAVGVRGARRG